MRVYLQHFYKRSWENPMPTIQFSPLPLRVLREHGTKNNLISHLKQTRHEKHCNILNNNMKYKS